MLWGIFSCIDISFWLSHDARICNFITLELTKRKEKLNFKIFLSRGVVGDVD